jgi:hypothetical protein
MIKEWNDLPDTTKNIGSLDDLKYHLKRLDTKTPKYYYLGKRKVQLILARLRMNCSKLSKHLYDMHIIEDQSCECGHESEDADHFFFECPNYVNQRAVFGTIDPSITISTKTFLYGDKTNSNTDNTTLFRVVSDYIIKTKRFD